MNSHYGNAILIQRIAADAHKVMESERDGIATGVGYHERRVADAILDRGNRKRRKTLR